MTADLHRTLWSVISQDWWVDDVFARQAVAMRRAELRLWAARSVFPALWPFANDLHRSIRHLTAMSTGHAKARDSLLRRTLLALGGKPTDAASDVVLALLAEMATYLGAPVKDALPRGAKTTLYEGGRAVLTLSTLERCEARVDCEAIDGVLSVRYRTGFWASYAHVALQGVLRLGAE